MAKDRRSREAEALRANLLKRKAQLRAREEKKPADDTADDVREERSDEASSPDSIARGKC